MIARRSVWTDDEVKELAARFVTVADEVGQLQRGDDAESELFLGFCEEGHYGGRQEPTGTRQGIYAVTPSGVFLASINTRSAAAMAKMLRTALAKWESMPAASRRLDDTARERLLQTKRFEDLFPSDGLVLAQYARDLAESVEETDWRANAWNLDQVWLRREEARQLVPSAKVGAEVEVPRALIERLVCLHLVDSVRGQTSSFRSEHVVAGELRSTVVAVDGQRLTLRLDGRTEAVQKGRWRVRDRDSEPVAHERGVRTTLEGRAVFDAEAGRFESFTLLATGERWGATQYNGRPADLTPTPIGFAFVIAPPDHPRVAPTYWWQYGWK